MFGNYHQAAFALIRDHEGRILWKKRRDFDLWDLPGGKADQEDFLEGLWAPELTALREVLEETGCHIDLESLFGRFYGAAISHDVPSLVLVFVARITNGQLCLSDEASGFGWYRHQELPPNSFTIHKDIVRQFERGGVDRWDLRYLAYAQRRVLLS